jgi:hypothetical protein
MEVLMVRPPCVNTVVSGRETSAMGKASHRGHRGHGGGMEVWMVGPPCREHRGIRARNKRNGESIAQRPQRSRRGNGGFDGGASLS